MASLLKLFEKILTSVLVSFLLFIAGFSYLTGHFPPRKDDLQKAWNYGRLIFTSTQDYHAQNNALAGQTLSPEQIVDLQRLALRRSEATIKFNQIFTRFPQGLPNPQASEKLNAISQQLTLAEKGLQELNDDLQKSMGGP